MRAHNLLKNNRIRGEIAQSKAHRSHKYVNNAWSEISNSPPTLLFIPFPVPPHWQTIWDHTSMWIMFGVKYPTPLQPCSLFPSLYHHVDKPYGITISLPPYSNMFVVLTYLKSTYVFDCLQHLSGTLFLISTTPLSMFHLHHNFQHLCLRKIDMNFPWQIVNESEKISHSTMRCSLHWSAHIGVHNLQKLWNPRCSVLGKWCSLMFGFDTSFTNVMQRHFFHAIHHGI